MMLQYLVFNNSISIVPFSAKKDAAEVKTNDGKSQPDQVEYRQVSPEPMEH